MATAQVWNAVTKKYDLVYVPDNVASTDQSVQAALAAQGKSTPASTAPAPNPTPALAPAPAPTSAPAPAPAAPQGSGIFSNPSAPQGWGVDASGHFVQIPQGYVLQGNQYVAPGGASNTSNAAPYVVTSTGQTISPQDPNYQTYVAQGAKPVGGTAPASTGPAATGTTGATGAANDPSALLKSMGVDTSNLTPQQISALGAMAQVVQTNAANDKQIAPQSLSQADLQTYFDQAKSQLDPYYQDQLKIYQSDLMNQVGQITGELPQAEQAQAEQFKQQQTQLASQMAEAGLAQSGIRRDAEAKLQEQQQGIVQSNRRALQQQINTLGSAAEKAYGTQTSSLIPQVTSQAMAGLPSANIGYKPIGVQYPTQPQQEQQDIINRQTQLAQQGLAQKNFLTTGTYTQT